MKISRLIASGLGSGFLPWVPGTWGSLLTVILIKYFLPPSFLALTFFSIVIGILGWTSLAYLDRKTIVNDAGWITIDEFLGQSLAFLGFYPNFPDHYWQFILAFLLFRLFDMLKPFPVNYFDKIKSRNGIMMDDIAAGILAALIICIKTHLI